MVARIAALIGIALMATASAGAQDRIRVVTYNLWHGMGPRTFGIYGPLEPKARRHARERAQTELLRAFYPHVTLLQECNWALKRAPHLAEAVDADYSYQPDAVGLKVLGVGIPPQLNSGLVTLVDRALPSIKFGAVSLSHPRFNYVRARTSAQFREERFALFDQVRTPNGRLVLIVNTHLHDGPEDSPELRRELTGVLAAAHVTTEQTNRALARLARADERRAREVAVLLAEIARREPAYDAVVLGGDLNITPSGDVHRRLSEFGFRDAWAEANGRDPGFTFDPSRNFENYALGAARGRGPLAAGLSASPGALDAIDSFERTTAARPGRLDYVWVKTSGGLGRVVRAQLIGTLARDGVVPSDHYGVMVDLDF